MLRELGGFLLGRELAVAVLDRPVVVGAERGHVVLALLLALERDVDRRCTPSPSRRGRSAW